MRFFHYRATDSTGRPAEGTIRAATAEAARAALTQAGYRVSSVGESVAAPIAQAAPAAPRPVREPARVAVAAAAPVTMHVQTAAPPATHKTKFGKDKDLFFLFAQLAQYFRAGMNPQMALTDLAQKSRLRYQDSLREAAGAVAEGKRMSDVFERYPYLYPPDVVGTIRAGEVSGYLGEALGNIADQMHGSNKLKKRLSWFLITFVATVVSFPLSMAVVNGSLASMKAQDQAGGELPVAGTLLQGIGQSMVRMAPIALPTLVLFCALMFFWHSMPMRRIRHQAVLAFPILGGRAKAEAMARFTWAMGMISRGGTSAHNTFVMASETVPNLIIRERLMGAAQTMHEAERLSTALKRSNALPVEYSHIVETGEVTGDVPRALSDVGRATDADFRARDASAVKLVSFVFLALLGLLTLALTAIVYKTFYGGMIETMTSGD